MRSEEFLQAGRLDDALTALEAQVRADPANAKLRVFLFQLLSAMGDWERALSQLNITAELDAMNLLMAQVCRAAINCEALRAEIFAGKRSPLVFGEPDEWIGLLVQANQMIAEGKFKASQKLREQAFGLAPSIAGSVNGVAFDWIADADTRLGPMLEAIFDGKYYWVPFTAIRRIKIEPPADLRDVVWISTYFTWVNDGETAGLIPTRYPGSESSKDNAIRLARKTEWLERPGEIYLGLGQRMFATDKDEFPLLQIRQIDLNHPETKQQGGEAADG
ncbi:MAG: tetratricopeptide repeat protein [Sedimentisphaerales bacterium]|nr:tetratricopeptide repeat protein [Sedimentisphaerales bacterium]